MDTVGPILSIPVGFAVFTVIVIVIQMVLAEVAWRYMEHRPEDEENWSAGNRFVMKEDL